MAGVLREDRYDPMLVTTLRLTYGGVFNSGGIMLAPPHYTDRARTLILRPYRLRYPSCERKLFLVITDNRQRVVCPLLWATQSSTTLRWSLFERRPKKGLDTAPFSTLICY